MVPISPPDVTTRSPFLRAASICSRFRRSRCWGRITRKKKMPSTSTIGRSWGSTAAMPPPD
jgi:hypothetical protein